MNKMDKKTLKNEQNEQGISDKTAHIPLSLGATVRPVLTGKRIVREVQAYKQAVKNLNRKWLELYLNVSHVIYSKSN